MVDRLRINRSLIEPVYQQKMPDESIDLGTVAVELQSAAKTYRGDARAVLRFLPRTALSLAVAGKPDDPLFGHRLFNDASWNGKLRLKQKGAEVDVRVSSVRGMHGDMVFTPTTSVITVAPPSTAIKSATFHVFNFPDFSAPNDYKLTHGDPPIQGFTLCGRVILRADGWIITIAAVADTNDRCKNLAAQGGHIITENTRLQAPGRCRCGDESSSGESQEVRADGF